MEKYPMESQDSRRAVVLLVMMMMMMMMMFSLDELMGVDAGDRKSPLG
jgi:hypothetical protein